jgi:hypothetical protein
MKTRQFILILILILAVLITVGSCATSKKSYISEDNLINELTGIWYNEEYEPPTVEKWPQVTVHSDGSFEFYKEYAELTTPARVSGHFISIKEAWTDSKGNIWYQAKAYDAGKGTTFYEIGKISDTGKVWESVLSHFEYPDKLDSESLNYYIRYRPE